MNLRTKKGIAKEILYFFTGIVSILIFWGSIKVRNYYYQNKVVSHNKEISELENKISKLENQNDLLIIPSKRNVFNKNIEILKKNNSSEYEINFMTKAFKDKFSIEHILKEYVATANNEKYNRDYDVINSKFPELKGYDPKVLRDYVATANSENYNSNFDLINSKFPEFFSEQIKINELKKNNKTEANKLNNTYLIILNRDDIIHIMKIFSIIIFGLIYPVRIIFISVKWAIKVLKIN